MNQPTVIPDWLVNLVGRLVIENEHLRNLPPPEQPAGSEPDGGDEQ